jgi:hypothetical protein
MVTDSLLPLGRWREEENTVHDDGSVDEMAGEVLMRQAKVRADRTGESIEEALEAVLNTEAGTQLRDLRAAPHGEESVEEWQVGMARDRAQERAEDLGDHLEEPRSTPRTAEEPKFLRTYSPATKEQLHSEALPRSDRLAPP